MNHTPLYALAKAYMQAGLDEIFSENDLICVVAEDGTPYYVSIAQNAFAAYRGEKGLTGYLALSLEEESASDLAFMDLQQAQECLLALLDAHSEDLEEQELAQINESNVAFEEGSYPQFRSKLQYQYPWYLSEAEQRDLCLILEAMLFAKTYFADYKKQSKHQSFSYWLDSLRLEESETHEYIPCLQKAGEDFTVTARVLQDEAYGFSYPQAYFTDEEKQLYYKRMKAKPGKVYYHAIGLLSEAMMPEKGERPVFPIFSMVYDPQLHQILDVFLVEDYDEEHGKFVSRLLELFEENGKPQAIHCFGKRTLPLLSKLGPQIGIMVVDGGENQEMDAIIENMFEELSQVYDSHDHDHHHHEHGPDCSCHHHGDDQE
ncbi:MAG: hypothetical protein AB7C91_00610 [Sphaerochaeta sp.]|jgi:hypothetical protein|uniref:DUF6930 domain-containing protein n=1 Tax=Sphaerochaeta sp. TaxID=1972642 RepID=UPI003D0E1B4A